MAFADAALGKNGGDNTRGIRRGPCPRTSIRGSHRVRQPRRFRESSGRPGVAAGRIVVPAAGPNSRTHW